jgi:hypothetical protein
VVLAQAIAAHSCRVGGFQITRHRVEQAAEVHSSQFEASLREICPANESIGFDATPQIECLLGILAALRHPIGVARQASQGEVSVRVLRRRSEHRLSKLFGFALIADARQSLGSNAVQRLSARALRSEAVKKI